MKLKSFLLYIILLSIHHCLAQTTPNTFKYQAVVRDNNGQVIANKLVAIKLSLLANSTNGAEVYAEVHNIATNDFGVANLLVGAGNNVLGNFNTIDWGASTYFLKTELDLNNGSNFTFLGTSQLLSVPFALYAAKSANAANDFDKDSLNEIQNISLTGNNLQLNKNGGSIDLSKYTNDADSQSLTLSKNTLSISRGNSILLNDIDSVNEIQTLSLNNHSLQLSKNGGNIDLSKYDKDSQQLVLNGNTLSITKGNSVVLSGVVDLDADPTNEIQNLSLINDTLKISKANFVKLPKDNDSDSSNEIQTLSISQNKLILSKSNQVNIDADTLNEIQTLTFVNDTLKLSKQINTAPIPSINTVQMSKLQYAQASGANTINLTMSGNLSSYQPGMIVNFKAVNNNTGPVLININGLGNKSLLKNISIPLDSGDIRTNQMVSIIYDGVNFQFLVAPYANKADKSNKLSNDSLGGLVPKGTIILSENNEPKQGYTLVDIIKKDLSLDWFDSSSTCPICITNDSIYFNNRACDIKTKSYISNLNIPMIQNGIKIGQKIFLFDGSNFGSYDLTSKSTIWNNKIKRYSKNNLGIDFFQMNYSKMVNQNNNIIFLQRVQIDNFNPAVGPIYIYENYKYIIDKDSIIKIDSINTTKPYYPNMFTWNNDVYFLNGSNTGFDQFYKIKNNDTAIINLNIPSNAAFINQSGLFFNIGNLIICNVSCYNMTTNNWIALPERTTNFISVSRFLGNNKNSAFFLGVGDGKNNMFYEFTTSLDFNLILSLPVTTQYGTNYNFSNPTRTFDDKLFFWDYGYGGLLYYLNIGKTRYLFRKD